MDLEQKGVTEVRAGAIVPAATFPSGTRIGAYRLEALVAEGGMGSVYRATDTKLSRPVAIKFLSERVADAQARRRFQQEAETTSQLNHPHIVTVHDVGEHEGRQYIVSELVDGGTLEDWHRRPHSWRQSVELVTGVADGVAAAHAAGILHRDIKPGNILIGKNGYAKLADFGLAKLAAESRTDPAAQSNAARTEIGIVVGTVAYMSPEQAAGQPLDERSDIFSFAVVLYELLAGRRPFEANNDLELMKTIVHGAAPPLPDDLPEALRIAVEKALEKDAAERYQSMRELVVDLKRVVQKRSSAAAQKAARPTRSRVAVAAGLAAALTAALVTAAAYYLRPEPPPRQQTRFQFAAPGFRDQDGGSLAISNDGSKIAYVAGEAGDQRIWIRPIEALEAQVLPGTTSATQVYWSPDGRSLAFPANGRLHRIGIDGGPAVVLTEAGGFVTGGSWAGDGTIFFASAVAGGGVGATAIGRVSQAGGRITALTKVATEHGEAFHLAPRVLPDGRGFLFGAIGGPVGSNGTGTIHLASLDGTVIRPLLTLSELRPNELQFDYAGGFLLFVRGETLLAQRLDLDAGELTGDAFPLASPVRQFAVSDNGVVVYRQPPPGPASSPAATINELHWFDRAGNALGVLAGPAALDNPKISPDGTRVAVDLFDAGNRDIWTIDAERGGSGVRLTFDRSFDVAPIWSPTGDRIVFASARGGGVAVSNGLYWRPANGAGTDELLYFAGATKAVAPLHVTPDNQYLLFAIADLSELTTRGEIRSLELTGERTVSKVLAGDGRLGAVRVSPNGRWITYATNESGNYDIVVQPFPDTQSGKWQISTGGGSEPKWRADGRELFYMGLNGEIMAVEIGEGEEFVFGEPRLLFDTEAVVPALPFGFQFDVTGDGQRFLVKLPARSEATGPPSTLTVITNWEAGLPR